MDNALITSPDDLPSIIDRARASLACARTFAEILEAKEMALMVHDAARRAARLAKVMGAHDRLVADAHRLKADALAIEHQAACRLADEYDAAQERGEVHSAHTGARKGVPEENAISLASSAEIGVSRKAIFEARQVRDAEAANPGVIKRALDGILEAAAPAASLSHPSATARPSPRRSRHFSE